MIWQINLGAVLRY